LVFFTDRNLGKAFPSILRAAGLAVERLDDHFADDTPDEVWLEAVAANGWIVISYDRRIRYKPNEIAAIRRAGARVLLLIGKAPFIELARSFVATMPSIERFAAEQEAPWIAKVYRAGDAERLRRSDAPGTILRWFP
jgi:hypothetical protein